MAQKQCEPSMSADGCERVIGELLEFKRDAGQKFDKLENKIDKLLEFKWRVAGSFGAILLVFEVIKIIVRLKG